MWASDAYFRPGLTKVLTSTQIVLVESIDQVLKEAFPAPAVEAGRNPPLAG